MDPSSTTHAHVQIHQAASATIWSYWPIAAVYAIAVVFALYTVQWHSGPDYMSHVMGWVLILFGSIKLSDVTGFARGFSMYDPLAKRSLTYAQTYPFTEIALGILFILQLFVITATLITLFIYSASLYGAIKSIRNKEALHCVCLGTYFTLPLSTVTIIEASFMVLMCLSMLIMFNTMTTMVM